MKIKSKVLYLSYEGMTDALGQSQVLAYMEKLSSTYHVSIVSYEKKNRFATFGAAIRERCQQLGIEWHPLIYTKSPPVLSTIYNVREMLQFSKKLFRTHNFQIVHCRSYITSIVGLALKKKYGCAFIFDMRGFWVDERIEAGYWKPGHFLYGRVINYFREKEKQFYADSDAIIVLTQAAKEVILSATPQYKEKIHVIPTCVNLEVFQPFQQAIREKVRNKLGIPLPAFVLLYSGGYGANYNIDFLLKVYNRVKKSKPETCILVLSKDGISGLEDKKELTDVYSISLPYAQVGEHLMAGDLGVINYVNDFSVAGRSPTKLGEYWASGLPAVAPGGIGDVDYLFSHYKHSGIIYTDADFDIKLKEIEGVQKDLLRGYAEEYFGLVHGAALYNIVYSKLLTDG